MTDTTVRARGGVVRTRHPIHIRELEVLRTRRITPAMLRVTLGGEQAAGFESHVADEHVKLVFPDPDTGRTRAPVPAGELLDWPRPMPPTREYTVRRYDRIAGELDLDFVLHDGGLASAWAANVQPGARIPVAGPPSEVVVPPVEHVVLAGDETALPAIGRWLQEWPTGATGQVLVEVADAGEQQPLATPVGVRLSWLHRHGAAAGTTTLLADAVTALEVPRDRSLYVWIAGEAGRIKPLRRWVRDDLGLGLDRSSITGYWKRGSADTHVHLDD